MTGAILAIDTAGVPAAVALALGGQTFVPAPDAEAVGRAEKLLGHATQLLLNHGLKIQDLQGLAVITGPGSYTGLRVGLALVRGLALVDDLPVASLGSLELAALCSQAQPGAAVACVQNGGRGRVYAAGYRVESGAAVPIFEPVLLTGQQLSEILNEHSTAPWRVCGDADNAAVQGWDSALAELADGPYECIAERRVGRLAAWGLDTIAAGGGTRAGLVLPAYVGELHAQPNRNRVAAVSADAITT